MNADWLAPAGMAAAATLGAGLLLVYAASAAWRMRQGKIVRYGSLLDPPKKIDEPGPGAVVGGRYILGTLLERVGERAVYEGRDLADSPRTVVRLRRGEGLAKRAAQALPLRHPHIAVLNEVLEEGGGLYLVYEPVGSDSLRRLLDRLPGGRYTAEQSLRLLKSACDALDYAHDRGLRHGALTPAMIAIDDGQVRLWNFGLTPEASETDYLPEGGQAGPGVETDLFALGACLYEALTGARPFRLGRSGAPAASMLAPGLPDGIDAFFSRALHPDPAARFHAAAEMFNAFRSLVVPVVQ